MKTTQKNRHSGTVRSSWISLSILGIVATFVMYVETMVIPAIPDMIKDFSIPYSTSSWILASYLVTAAVTAPILGKLSDVYGRKKLLLISVMIYSVGIALGGFANNLPIMLVARSMQGIGFAVIPISFSIIRNKFPEDKLPSNGNIYFNVCSRNSNRCSCWWKYRRKTWMACHIFHGIACDDCISCSCKKICNRANSAKKITT